MVSIKKQQYYLWRAVDAEGNVLDVLLQLHRDTKAAQRFFRKLLKKQGFVPRVIVMDKLKSYEAAKNQMLKSVEHRYSQGVEQPGGELPRLRHTNARATDATIQIARASPTLSFCFQTESRPLSPQATSTHCTTIPRTTPPTTG